LLSLQVALWTPAVCQYDNFGGAIIIVTHIARSRPYMCKSLLFQRLDARDQRLEMLSGVSSTYRSVPTIVEGLG
jgi:hypothetical protein